MSRWEDAGKAITGGGTGDVVLGSRFAVEASNADQAAEIATKVGGKTV